MNDSISYPDTECIYYSFDAAGNHVGILDGTKTGLTADLLFWLWRSSQSALAVDIVGVLTSSNNNLRLDFWNQDGTRELVCGNGIRCVALLFRERSKNTSPTVVVPVDTGYATFNAVLLADGSAAAQIPLSKVCVATMPTSSSYLVDVGTLHMVEVVDDIKMARGSHTEETLQRPTVISHTCIEYRENEILARTFERGVGETGSCGTGAMAIYASHYLGLELTRDTEVDRMNTLTIKFITSGAQLQVNPVFLGSCMLEVSGNCSLIGQYYWDCGAIREDFTPTAMSPN